MPSWATSPTTRKALRSPTPLVSFPVSDRQPFGNDFFPFVDRSPFVRTDPDSTSTCVPQEGLNEGPSFDLPEPKRNIDEFPAREHHSSADCTTAVIVFLAISRCSEAIDTLEPMTRTKTPKNPRGKRHYNGEWYKEVRIDREKGVVVLRDNKEPFAEFDVPISYWGIKSAGLRTRRG